MTSAAKTSRDKLGSRKSFFFAWLLLGASLALLGGCTEPVPDLRPLSRDGVILTFGDSLTAGTGADVADSYPAVLQRLTGHRVINGGVPGEVSADGRKRLQSWLDQHQPELLVLCHGGNDLLRRQSTDALKNNLAGMIEMAHQHGVQVMLVAVPKPTLLGLEAAPLYDELAAQFELPIERDIIVDLQKRSNFKSDHVHFNAEGYAEMAKAIGRLLTRSGAIESSL